MHERYIGGAREVHLRAAWTRSNLLHGRSSNNVNRDHTYCCAYRLTFGGRAAPENDRASRVAAAFRERRESRRSSRWRART
eukprot:1560411-Pleurochrysis_carterae.AAC.2